MTNTKQQTTNPGIVDGVEPGVVERGKEEEVKEGAMEVDPNAALAETREICHSH